MFPAEGEGRNAVFAATLGWKVSAFDISSEGRKKALRLAESAGVMVEYKAGGLETVHYAEATFDALALIYAHFPADIKSAYHRQLDTFLKPSGTLIFEAFSKAHLPYRLQNENVGGPSDIGMLFSKEELLEDFTGYEVLQLEKTLVTLHEGLYHNGTGSVIRFVGRKK